MFKFYANLLVAEFERNVSLIGCDLLLELVNSNHNQSPTKKCYWYDKERKTCNGEAVSYPFSRVP